MDRHRTDVLEPIKLVYRSPNKTQTKTGHDHISSFVCEEPFDLTFVYLNIQLPVPVSDQRVDECWWNNPNHVIINAACAPPLKSSVWCCLILYFVVCTLMHVIPAHTLATTCLWLKSGRYGILEVLPTAVMNARSSLSRVWSDEWRITVLTMFRLIIPVLH